VYVALPTALVVQPERTAMAFTVVVPTTRTGPVYCVEDVVGVVPFVV
jgi:hypothetical protein